MSKKKKALLIILAAVLTALIALGIWQRSNIRAVYIYLTREPEAIAQDMQRQREDNSAALAARGVSAVAPPTLEQSNDLLSGATTPEQVKDDLGITRQLAADPVAGEELLSQCVAELYACKVDIIAQLGELKQAALEQWRALPPEQRTETMKREMVLDGLAACYELEVTVDDQVREILARYREPLAEAGGDTAALDELWGYYQNEKATEKAYYLGKYLE